MVMSFTKEGLAGRIPRPNTIYGVSIDMGISPRPSGRQDSTPPVRYFRAIGERDEYLDQDDDPDGMFKEADMLGVPSEAVQTTKGIEGSGASIVTLHAHGGFSSPTSWTKSRAEFSRHVKQVKGPDSP